MKVANSLNAKPRSGIGTGFEYNIPLVFGLLQKPQKKETFLQPALFKGRGNIRLKNRVGMVRHYTPPFYSFNITNRSRQVTYGPFMFATDSLSDLIFEMNEIILLNEKIFVRNSEQNFDDNV